MIDKEEIQENYIKITDRWAKHSSEEERKEYSAPFEEVWWLQANIAHLEEESRKMHAALSEIQEIAAKANGSTIWDQVYGIAGKAIKD